MTSFLGSRNTRLWSHLLGAAAALGCASIARAEGSDQLGAASRLQAATDLRVDIVDADVESIRWTGAGTLAVVTPGGATIATLASGERATLAGHGGGAYRVTMSEDQAGAWAIAVDDAVTPGGRVWSRAWSFAGADSEAPVQGASYFALVPGGGPGRTGVVQLQLGGLQAGDHRVIAAATGLRNGLGTPYAGMVPMSGHPLYLASPAIATHDLVAPETNAVGFSTAAGLACFAPGGPPGHFRFETAATGTTYRITCDLDQDGVFDPGAMGDLVLMGHAEPGANTVAWNATHRDGVQPVDAGTYACRVQLDLGAVHLLAEDVETAWPGVRMFRVTDQGAPAPLRMFWNDHLVMTSGGILEAMPQPGLVRSPVGGLDSGAYEAVLVPNENARAWLGRGNGAVLDTFTALASSEPVELLVSVDPVGCGAVDPVITEPPTDPTDPTEEPPPIVPGAPDADGDDLPDAIDLCPTMASAPQLDLDADGAGDACDDDDDADGRTDDADNCPRIANPNQGDLDHDTQGDVCEDDDDGDGHLDMVDVCPRLADDQADLDADGTGDACDGDDDGDGAQDVFDNCPRTPNTAQANQDRDPHGDACDLDADGDGVVDFFDNCLGLSNPEQHDADHDGAGDDCDEPAPDGEGTGTNGGGDPGTQTVPAAAPYGDGAGGLVMIDRGNRLVTADQLERVATGDGDDDDLAGGCSTGGGATSGTLASMLLGAVALLRRRRAAR